MSTDGGRTPSPDQLDGWKEIAAYLGRSVRAAQRWERDMALPVHRLKTPGGQVVFAHRGEIDEWKAGAEVLRNGAGDALEDQPGDRGHGQRPGWTLFLAAAVLFVLAAVLFAAAWFVRA